MITGKKRRCFMLFLLPPCFFMTGCYRGSVNKRIEPIHRPKHEEKSKATQPIGITKVMPAGQWYVTYLAINGCIVGFLILGNLLRAIFGPAPTNHCDTIQEEVHAVHSDDDAGKENM